MPLNLKLTGFLPGIKIMLNLFFWRQHEKGGGISNFIHIVKKNYFIKDKLNIYCIPIGNFFLILA